MNNNINFTARLNVQELTNNKSRWERVSEEFEKQTKNIPNGEVRIRPTRSGKGLDITLTSKKGTNLDLYLDSVSAKEFSEMSDSKIISKLKKLFNINKQNDKILKAYDNFCDALDEEILAENEDTLSVMAYSSITENSIKSLKKDKFLKDLSSEWGFDA